MNEGKKDRRDPIRTIKTKNPVAKAHQTVGTGSGAHKDKKRAMKQGEVKHKNAEYAEHLESSLKKAILESNPQYNKFRVGQRATFKNSQGQEFPVIVTAVDYDDDAVRFKHANNKPFPDGDLEQEVDPGWRFLTPDRSYDPNSLVKATSRQESINAEYDDEAGMADNNLETLKRAVDGIDNVIQTGDNLPEWCQEKIAVAKSMLVTVWDYMLSEKDSEHAVAEASALEKFRKASAEREKKHNDAEKEMNARHARGKEDMKGAIDRLEKHVNAKEGWTHDSLAAELFETENTYEDRLNNLLNKRLGQ
jgi:hypothetical protein